MHSKIPDQEREEIRRKIQKELSSGTVSLVLLAHLEKVGEPLYGYRIAKDLAEMSLDGALMKQGTLYPVLRAMQKRGWLESEVEPSVSGPPRRYYSITDRGREVLQLWRESWIVTRDFVDRILSDLHNKPQSL